ncbi:hypothetical protein An02g10600 [Aspergillus niger]|uniref:Uncharacterized protein n=2 Tax=Aspergillus niger TaxID=5061 RepID=A5AAG7_ASPNC|nr:hypothetical protein An02g10600 [Aspergillus niger]CAK44409.1 hypothetical protein An02g10600 [Aspergillus niger]
MGNDDSRTGLVSVWTQGGLWTVDCGGGEAQRVQYCDAPWKPAASTCYLSGHLQGVSRDYCDGMHATSY